MMKVLKKKRKGGFTLIELIVVIAILGILAAIAVPRFSGFTQSAKEAADKAAATTITNAVKMYVAANDVKTDLAAQKLKVLEDANLIEAGIAFESDKYLKANADITWAYTASTGVVVVTGKVAVPVK